MTAPDLAAAAREELRVREALLPAMVARGAIAPGEAAFELAAWRILPRLLDGAAVETDINIVQLELALRRASRRRHDALAACADPSRRPGLAARRDAVEAIHARIIATRRAMERDNNALAWERCRLLREECVREAAAA